MGMGLGDEAKSMRAKGMSERDAVLVHLKNEKRKGKDAKAQMGPVASGEKYPYGMRMHVEGDHAKKLGLHKAKAGDKIHARMKGKIVSVHHDERDGEAPSHRVEIQITHMSPAGDGSPMTDSDDDQDGEQQD